MRVSLNNKEESLLREGCYFPLFSVKKGKGNVLASLANPNSLIRLTQNMTWLTDKKCCWIIRKEICDAKVILSLFTLDQVKVKFLTNTDSFIRLAQSMTWQKTKTESLNDDEGILGRESYVLYSVFSMKQIKDNVLDQPELTHLIKVEHDLTEK